MTDSDEPKRGFRIQLLRGALFSQFPVDATILYVAVGCGGFLKAPESFLNPHIEGCESDHPRKSPAFNLGLLLSVVLPFYLNYTVSRICFE